MLCDVCKEGIEGVWDPSRTKRMGKKPEGFGILLSLWEPKVWEEFWSSLLEEDREDLKDLDPDECVFAHHKTKASFVASVEDGCTLCNYFLESTNPRISLVEEPGKEQDTGYFSTLSFSGPCDYRDESYERGYFSAKIHTRTHRGGVLPERGRFVDSKPYQDMNYEYQPTTNSPRTWSIIDDWMGKCTESHQACRRPDSATSYRPSRLLEMNNSNSFRLVQGSECPTAMQYVALSYCWGPKPAHSLLRLLRSTISGLSEWQPIGGLPKTFRDAVNIAQRLGIHYLWIDRLCILQDSAEDWRHEASTMQDVYRNAYIGIGALSAKDDEGGCFFERDPAKVGPTVLSLKIRSDGKRMNFMSQMEPWVSWRYTFKNEPLCQRSWVVQERLLAPRTLYFGAKQVFWECRATACCEMHPEGMDSNADIAQEAPTEQLWKQLLATSSRKPSGLSNRSQLFFDWNAIVEHYTNLQLTIASDKLVALSGLANDMKKRLNELRPGPHRYLAGLWEDELMTQLTWCVRGSAKRVSQYRAPSWSWACLDGYIKPGREGLSKRVIDLASMISAEMVYPTEEETGEVKNGILTLEGPCMWAKPLVKAAQYHTWAMTLSTSAHQVRIWFDTLDDVTEEAFLWTCGVVDPFFRVHLKGLALALIGNGRYRRLGVILADSRSEEDLKFIEALPQTQVKLV